MCWRWRAAPSVSVSVCRLCLLLVHGRVARVRDPLVLLSHISVVVEACARLCHELPPYHLPHAPLTRAPARFFPAIHDCHAQQGTAWHHPTPLPAACRTPAAMKSLTVTMTCLRWSTAPCRHRSPTGGRRLGQAAPAPVRLTTRMATAMRRASS